MLTKSKSCLTEQTKSSIRKTSFQWMALFSDDTLEALRAMVLNHIQPFIQWFHHHVIRTLLENTSQQLERLPTTRRVHVLAGRAGQGKSTLMRHAFLHVKRQWDEENPRIQPNLVLIMKETTLMIHSLNFIKNLSTVHITSKLVMLVQNKNCSFTHEDLIWFCLMELMKPTKRI